MNIKDKLKECMNEGKKGERHKGLKEIEPSVETAQGHVIDNLDNCVDIKSKFSPMRILVLSQ